MPTTRSSLSTHYITTVLVLCLLAASDAGLVMKVQPTAISPDSNENLTICCSITNNRVEHLNEVYHLTLTRFNIDFDPLVSLYINKSSSVEFAPLLDTDRYTFTFGETDFCLTMSNVTTYEVTYYRCEAHGHDASNTKQKIYDKILVSKLPAKKETNNDRSKGPEMTTSTSFNHSESEIDKEYKHQESETYVIFSVFEAGPKIHSQLMGDNRSISGSRNADIENATLRVSVLWFVTVNRQELIDLNKTCIDHLMYFLDQFNQSLLGLDHISSLAFNSSSATKPDPHACVHNESHSFFGIIGSELDMRMVCAFNVDKIYVFFSSLWSPFEIDLELSTYKSKKSIRNVLNDLLLCVENLKSVSSNINLLDKILNVLSSVICLNEQKHSETQSASVNVTFISENRYCSLQYNTTKHSTLENDTSTEQLKMIIEQFKILLTKNHSENIQNEKKLLSVLKKYKDDHVLTNQTITDLLNALEYKLKGELMETYAFLINKIQVQMLRNFSVLGDSIQELNNSSQETLQNHFTRISATDNFTLQLKQDLDNFSDNTFNMISKIQNQTNKHYQLQKDFILKIELIDKYTKDLNLTYQSDYFNFSKLLQFQMNNLDGFRENVSNEILKTKDRINNLEQLLEVVNSVRESIEYDLRNVNVTIRTELTALSKHFKEDFNKFLKDFHSYRDRASFENIHIKARIDKQERLLKELDSGRQVLEHDIRNINKTFGRDTTTLFESSQNLKKDFIKFVKAFDTYTNQSFLENTQIKDRIDNQEELLKLFSSESNSLKHDIRNINVTLLANMTTLSEFSKNLNEDFIKFVKDFDVYRNRVSVKMSEIEDQTYNNEQTLKLLVSGSKTVEQDIKNMILTLRDNVTKLYEEFHTLKDEIDDTLKYKISTIQSQVDKLVQKNNEVSNENTQFNQLYSQLQVEKTYTQNVRKAIRGHANNSYHVSSSLFGHRYYLTKEKMFEDVKLAQTICALLGGYLAEMDNTSELKFVQNFLSLHDSCASKTAVMIGGTDEDEEGRWVHISSGTPVVTSFWGNRQPDGGRKQNCQAIQECRDLHDYPCYLKFSSRKKMLCEVPE